MTAYAQALPSGEVVSMHVVVQIANTIEEFDTNLDSDHIGAQIKCDILDKKDLPISEDLRKHPDLWHLVIQVTGRKILLGNFQRLIKYKELYQKGPATLSVLEPGTMVELK